MMDQALITRHRGDFLRGSFLLSGRDGAVITRDPSTGITLDEVPFRKASVPEAVTSARDAFAQWALVPLPQRLRRVHLLRDVLSERQGLLSALASREMGKPLWECELECAAAVRALDLLMEQAEEMLAPKPHPSVPGVLRRRPIGVVGILTPFPFPIYGAIQVVLPCLLAGNSVIWKPSSRVPLTSQRVADVFDAARFPSGSFSMVQGPRNPIGRALMGHPDVDMLAVAGSAEPAALARATGKRTWTQCGGKGWAFVAADADLDRAAYEIVTGAYLSTGQRCNATSRVVVEREVARPLLRRVVALVGGLSVGAPTDRDVFCGPLVDIAARRRFHAALKAYAEAGVEFPVEGGGGQLPSNLRRRGQCFVAPALGLVDGALPKDLLSPEEVEGPLVIAQLVDSLDEGIDAYNAHPYGMAAAVFCAGRARFESVARRVLAGSVNWNRGTIVASARFPNAGLRRSGDGAEGNAALLLATTTSQSTLIGSGRFDPRHRVPGMAWPEAMGTLEPVDAHTPPYPGLTGASPIVVDPHRVSTGRMPAVVLPDEPTQ
jgi:alpha-ketoglutaric semialdehyde dehydrogenase